MELAIFLFAVGILLVVLETVIPSMGLLTLLALTSFGFSVWRALVTAGSGAAIAMGIVAPIITIAILYYGLKYLPRTSFGRGLVLRTPEDEGARIPPTASETYAVSAEGGTDEERLEAFVGKEGLTQSALRPAGIAIVDGQRLDCVTEGAMIEAGERVKILAVEGNRVVVRRVKD